MSFQRAALRHLGTFRRRRKYPIQQKMMKTILDRELPGRTS